MSGSLSLLDDGGASTMIVRATPPRARLVLSVRFQLLLRGFDSSELCIDRHKRIQIGARHLT